MNYHLMKNLFKSLIVLITLFFLSCSAPKTIVVSGFKINPIDVKVDSILKLMTLEEKVGQMNQYNGFWDSTGPTPKDGQAAKKICRFEKRSSWCNAKCKRRKRGSCYSKNCS